MQRAGEQSTRKREDPVTQIATEQRESCTEQQRSLSRSRVEQSHDMDRDRATVTLWSDNHKESRGTEIQSHCGAADANSHVGQR